MSNKKPKGGLSKNFIRKDVLGGMFTDFPRLHGRIVLYALEEGLRYTQNKNYSNFRTSFITEVHFDTDEQCRDFYDNIEDYISNKGLWT